MARELFLLFSQMGKEIRMDQGSYFISIVMSAMCRLVKVTQIQTSVYRHQTDGLVERFNKTLKVQKMINTDGKD